MARLPRLSLPGYPHHVILRGNNRQAIFSCPADYQTLLDLIEEHARKSGVAVHAYVLMSNHVHLLVTPEAADSLPSMMQAVGRRYVRYFNDRQGRSGTLWEGRYRSTPIQTETYLLACMAYIDLNPVRAGLVAEARDYPWSSHGHYVGLRSDRLVTPHPLFWTLGNTPFAREAAYADMVRGGVSASQQAALTESALSGWALGNADFLTDLQKITERRVVKTRVGRPARKPDGP
ncbi:MULTISPECIES: transposase [unclassified Polaromonas]|jgi:putative transposase|uniref:REP-associated tyrosine transposase n=1 Tax=unclassified Polaromonas TaxID=2638319 RepID=UPI000BC47ED8|nr:MULTISPECIES: transposase [unclassified Polaromonas]OYY35888.1 MAG: transposase [Polaromonas sp. 35-63-35]OYZ19806.1 MAG: transposase [Polaromonas sp. 16-63-31]OYZ79925.1 MAG: transposase [Polaromonas sp. 24-63-21]OZA52042.1 MAG: transposase [Polaromonas sp. 17-63-33]OZA87926.1 MAG: transposase [Polaromonas sp. 39-63-25]